jgi:hypothetical protein
MEKSIILMAQSESASCWEFNVMDWLESEVTFLSGSIVILPLPLFRSYNFVYCF